MLVQFDQMPAQARLWVYQADRSFTQYEKEFIEQQCALFIEQWTAHGSNLKASYAIYFDQFLVISVDENFNQVSGCSIDSSVRFVQFLQEKLGLNFMDRSRIAFLEEKPPQQTIVTRPFNTIKDGIAAGEIGGNTIVFNNMVTSKADFDRNWRIESKNSWLGKYF